MIIKKDKKEEEEEDEETKKKKPYKTTMSEGEVIFRRGEFVTGKG